jgi:hypothetical protein
MVTLALQSATCALHSAPSVLSADPFETGRLAGRPFLFSSSRGLALAPIELLAMDVNVKKQTSEEQREIVLAWASSGCPQVELVEIRADSVGDLPARVVRQVGRLAARLERLDEALPALAISASISSGRRQAKGSLDGGQPATHSTPMSHCSDPM